MCTVSLVSAPDGAVLRVLMNRDERRLRPAAYPPATHKVGSRQALWPIDPPGGGTWIAATDAGLAFAVMNLTGPCRAPGRLSRGRVIPTLAGAGTIEDVLEAWERLDLSAFAPFRLLALARDRVAVCHAPGPPPVVRRIGRFRMFASSSLGDEGAAAVRGELFERMLTGNDDPWLAQTRFHQHAWPDRRDVSVMMSRVDACTRSQTEVRLTAASVALTYRPVHDGWPIGGTRLELPILPAAARAA
jgi:hypothetical protein